MTTNNKKGKSTSQQLNSSSTFDSRPNSIDSTHLLQFSSNSDQNPSKKASNRHSKIFRKSTDLAVCPSPSSFYTCTDINPSPLLEPTTTSTVNNDVPYLDCIESKQREPSESPQLHAISSNADESSKQYDGFVVDSKAHPTLKNLTRNSPSNSFSFSMPKRFRQDDDNISDYKSALSRFSNNQEILKTPILSPCQTNSSNSRFSGSSYSVFQSAASSVKTGYSDYNQVNNSSSNDDTFLIVSPEDLRNFESASWNYPSSSSTSPNYSPTKSYSSSMIESPANSSTLYLDNYQNRSAFLITKQSQSESHLLQQHKHMQSKDKVSNIALTSSKTPEAFQQNESRLLKAKTKAKNQFVLPSSYSSILPKLNTSVGNTSATHITAPEPVSLSTLTNTHLQPLSTLRNLQFINSAELSRGSPQRPNFHSAYSSGGSTQTLTPLVPTPNSSLSKETYNWYEFAGSDLPLSPINNESSPSRNTAAEPSFRQTQNKLLHNSINNSSPTQINNNNGQVLMITNSPHFDYPDLEFSNGFKRHSNQSRRHSIASFVSLKERRRASTASSSSNKRNNSTRNPNSSNAMGRSASVNADIHRNPNKQEENATNNSSDLGLGIVGVSNDNEQHDMLVSLNNKRGQKEMSDGHNLPGHEEDLGTLANIKRKLSLGKKFSNSQVIKPEFFTEPHSKSHTTQTKLNEQNRKLKQFRTQPAVGTLSQKVSNFASGHNHSVLEKKKSDQVSRSRNNSVSSSSSTLSDSSQKLAFESNFLPQSNNNNRQSKTRPTNNNNSSFPSFSNSSSGNMSKPSSSSSSSQAVFHTPTLAQDAAFEENSRAGESTDNSSLLKPITHHKDLSVISFSSIRSARSIQQCDDIESSSSISDENFNDEGFATPNIDEALASNTNIDQVPNTDQEQQQTKKIAFTPSTFEASNKNSQNCNNVEDSATANTTANNAESNNTTENSSRRSTLFSLYNDYRNIDNAPGFVGSLALSLAKAPSPSSILRRCSSNGDDGDDDEFWENMEKGQNHVTAADKVKFKREHNFHQIQKRRLNNLKFLILEYLKLYFKYITTLKGFAVTLYFLLIIAFGGMLFLLLCNAAPAMTKEWGPDDKVHSPRQIWIEIDSQILNALFCITGLGLFPVRARDFYYYIRGTSLSLLLKSNNEKSKKRIITKSSSGTFSRNNCIQEGTNTNNTNDNEQKHPDEIDLEKGKQSLEKKSNTIVKSDSKDVVTDDDNDYDDDTNRRDNWDGGDIYYRRKILKYHSSWFLEGYSNEWKLLTVILLYIMNSVFQVLLCVAMWRYNRFTRPSWVTGTLIAASFSCVIIAGIIMFIEATKVKKLLYTTNPDIKHQQKKEEQQEQEKKKSLEINSNQLLVSSSSNDINDDTKFEPILLQQEQNNSIEMKNL